MKIFIVVFGMLLITSSAWSGDYTIYGNGTVSDNSTGLMWQREDNKMVVSWQAALAYCEDLTLGDYDDWRMPNVKELESIIDDSRNLPAIDTVVFPDLNSLSYWSSTTHAPNTYYAWCVGFSFNGVFDNCYKFFDYPVRCVRNG